MLTLAWANERFTLWPEKALYWKKQKALLVADTHFGKDETFRTHGLGIPDGTLKQDLDRLTTAVTITQPEALFFLGDFFHTKEGVSDAVLERLENWMKDHDQLHQVLIRGNHDQHSGDPPENWNLEIHNEPYELGEIHLCHHPPDEPAKPTIAGHIHPSVRFGFGSFSEKCPCFFFSPRTAILPAFGGFTGNHCLPIGDDDHIVLVRDGKLARVK